MSDINRARRASIAMDINGADMTEDLNLRLLSLSWTDNEDGDADDLTVELVDRDNVVAGTWLATEIENRAEANLNDGTKVTLSPTITQENWEGGEGEDISLALGQFVVDSVTVKGGDSGQTVTMQATALDYSTSARNSTYTRAWEDTTLRAVASTIAGEAGYSLMYLADGDVSYTRKEQISETNASFLQRLCTAAGLSLKTIDGSLVIFSQNDYETKTTSRVITRGDGTYTSFTLDAELSDTCYSSCTVSWEDTDTGETIEYTYTPSGYTYDEDNVLTVSDEKVSSTAEAKALAIARLREANKGKITASFTFPGDILLVAGLTVELEDFGGFDGTYYIESSTHSVRASGGYTVSVSLRQSITEY